MASNSPENVRFERRTLALHGIVQGVGFRPALLRAARAAGLGGWVRNETGAVRLAIEGASTAIDAFLDRLPTALPPRARLETLCEVSREPLPADHVPTPFAIHESLPGDPPRVVIPPDLAVCPDCAREIRDPADRRYGYPFTTCTNCGPRFSVITDMPYDRERTTMNAFPLCEDCRREYADPNNRRFHAESTACPSCGPTLRLEDAAGRPVLDRPIAVLRAALRDGAIVAVKGLGGFLLTLDPLHEKALRRLRALKRRPDRPLAAMARSIEPVRSLCETPASAAALLASPEAPIVVLPVRADADARGASMAARLAPDTGTLGVLLPTSPLHALLFEPLSGDPVPPFDWLVMTSGNRRSEPIARTNEEARERLSGMADWFLFHDRDIHTRIDDSVCALRQNGPQLWRRARGYAPSPIRISRPIRGTVLALGGELKNAVAMARGAEIVLSPHIGDLTTPEALDGLDAVLDDLPRFLGWTPDRIAVDAHPDYRSSRRGRLLARESGCPVLEVQHHRAHAAAALAEHGLEEALVFAFDGTGWGEDGTIWGAELFRASCERTVRVASFAPAPLPGGDAAVRQPYRQLAARFLAAGKRADGLVSCEALSSSVRTAAYLETLTAQIERGWHCPRTRAAGRLFDAVSALLGLAPESITYEAQAPIRLESAAREGRFAFPHDAYRVITRGGIVEVDWSSLFADPESARAWRPRAAEAAWAFHDLLADAAVAMAHSGAWGEVRDVCLSGGVFMNRLFTDCLCRRLAAGGYRVHIHRAVPPNDGGLALGQAAAAGWGQIAE
jgi:hydrogenase maturation protein HypF